MIKVSVLYPNGNDVTFDRDYYVTKHSPLCQQLVGEALRNALDPRKQTILKK